MHAVKATAENVQDIYSYFVFRAKDVQPIYIGSIVSRVGLGSGSAIVFTLTDLA